MCILLYNGCHSLASAVTSFCALQLQTTDATKWGIRLPLKFVLERFRLVLAAGRTSACGCVKRFALIKEEAEELFVL